MFPSQIKHFFITLFLSCLFYNSVSASSLPNNDLKSPHNAIWAHLYYLQVEQYDEAEAIHPFLLEKDSSQAIKLAVELQHIYDWKGLYVQMDKIPTDSLYMDSIQQKAVFYPFPGELPDIYLKRINGQWLYSQHSLDRISSLHKEMGLIQSMILSLIPKTGQKALFGLQLWQYLGFLLLILAFLLIHLLLSKLLIPVVKRYLFRLIHKRFEDSRLVLSLANYLSYLILVQLLRPVIPMLQLGVDISGLITKAINIASTLIILFIALKILKIMVSISSSLTEKTESKMDDQLVPLIDKFLKVIIISLAILQILSFAGINITALLAGVSIGGLALALAAQDTVKNLLGSAMIFIDKPFQIGDYVSGPGFAGTIVEVGFRTTRIRTSTSSVISIPNGTVANATLDNFGARTFRLYQTTLGLTYDTSPAKIEEFIGRLKLLVEQEESIDNDSAKISFTELAASSLNILFKVPLQISSFDEEIEIKQRINLSILKIAEDIGVEFAFPSTSVYIEKQ